MDDRSPLDEAGLERLIPLFYARVREDAELGPIFNAAITDWPEHLEKLIAFWSSVMLTSGRYKGNPMAAHLRHRAAIAPDHFDRWLALWNATTAEVMMPEAAQALQDKAARIGESLSLALFFRLGGAQGSAAAPAACPVGG
ncbi:group III truncated hemoglobin [Sphingomonas sp. C3-2]|uniref:group III truncated hemoglobin n=1 Tax=Sphingomonas sp. C3-2 TaxID=3062169 RepID=UPI00294AB984|nr:group III truncated hemoglobin [Sphingomonas sp. C3-2]WOK38108.1 group III truncated hemoglobin [Sphingomonas sp. C3-2]